MKKIFNSITAGKFKGLKITFLCIIVAILIAEVVLEILNQNFGNISGKFALTFGLIAVALAMSINGLIRIEKGDKIVKGFALASLLMNIIWLIFAILSIWGVWENIFINMDIVDTYTTNTKFGIDYIISYRPPYYSWLIGMYLLIIIIAALSAINLLISNILAIIKSKKKR